MAVNPDPWRRSMKDAMIHSDDTSILALNRLIVTGRDAESGFRAAATDTRDPVHARLYGEYAAQRARFVADLESRVKDLRAEPAKTGSIAAALHRQWMDLEAGTSDHVSQTILHEVERGEALAVTAYREALQLSGLDEISRAMVQVQYEQVQAAHDRVKQLRDRGTLAGR